MKILCLDDERAPLYFLEKNLRELYPTDYIKVFDNYDSFIDSFEKLLPDVVFLDIEMPEVKGMDVAKDVQSIKNDVNIIFCTAYSKYALDALNVYASGYIVKPASKESIQNAINNLRYPITKEYDIEVKTFGNFDIFYNEEPIKFRSPKSKELLAYLVDRNGVLVSKKEIASILYEDDYSRNIQRTLSRNIQYLKEDLEKVGIKDFFIIDNGYRVDLTKCNSDLKDYLEGKNNIAYTGEYMNQYSWAELRKYSLANKKN